MLIILICDIFCVVNIIYMPSLIIFIIGFAITPIVGLAIYAACVVCLTLFSRIKEVNNEKINDIQEDLFEKFKTPTYWVSIYIISLMGLYIRL